MVGKSLIWRLPDFARTPVSLTGCFNPSNIKSKGRRDTDSRGEGPI
jgi:hypothetical protein